jgi:hypothetical protein
VPELFNQAEEIRHSLKADTALAESAPPNDLSLQFILCAKKQVLSYTNLSARSD